MHGPVNVKYARHVRDITFARPLIKSIIIRHCIYGHHTGLHKNCNDKIILAILL